MKRHHQHRANNDNGINVRHCPNCNEPQVFRTKLLTAFYKPFVCHCCHEDLVLRMKHKIQLFLLIATCAFWLLAVKAIVNQLTVWVSNTIIAGAIWLSIAFTLLYVFELFWQNIEFYRIRHHSKRTKAKPASFKLR